MTHEMRTDQFLSLSQIIPLHMTHQQPRKTYRKNDELYYSFAINAQPFLINAIQNYQRLHHMPITQFHDPTTFQVVVRQYYSLKYSDPENMVIQWIKLDEALVQQNVIGCNHVKNFSCHYFLNTVLANELCPLSFAEELKIQQIITQVCDEQIGKQQQNLPNSIKKQVMQSQFLCNLKRDHHVKTLENKVASAIKAALEPIPQTIQQIQVEEHANVGQFAFAPQLLQHLELIERAATVQLQDIQIVQNIQSQDKQLEISPIGSRQQQFREQSVTDYDKFSSSAWKSQSNTNPANIIDSNQQFTNQSIKNLNQNQNQTQNYNSGENANQQPNFISLSDNQEPVQQETQEVSVPDEEDDQHAQSNEQLDDEDDLDFHPHIDFDVDE